MTVLMGNLPFYIMQNTYLTTVENGETKLYEVSYKRTIPPEVLIGLKCIQHKKTFWYEGRKFYEAFYTDGNFITRVLTCPLLYWKMPLRYDNSNENIYIEGDDSLLDQVSVGIEDVRLIIHHGDDAMAHYCMYAVAKNDNAALFTNVFDDGRMCFPKKFEVSDPSENILAELENAPGNNHLLTDPTTNRIDARESPAPMYINDAGIPCLKVHDTFPLNHEQKKYLR